jgi:hypothetical protein
MMTITTKLSKPQSRLHVVLITICTLTMIHTIVFNKRSMNRLGGKEILSLSFGGDHNYLVNGHAFNDTRYWCIIDDNTTQMAISNIAHAAQILISCWNWFQRQSSITFNTTKRTCQSEKKASKDLCLSHSFCGFYIGNLTIRKLLKPIRKRDGWITLLIEHMPCVLTDLKPTRLDTVWHRPNLKLQFDNVESAFLFQSSIFHSLSTKHQIFSNYPRGNSITENAIRVGLVNRRDSRHIRNMHAIHEAFRKVLPTAHYEICFMEDLSPIEQWLFWSSKHIVLAGHGQAETNAIFLPPNSSVVIEIYPPHYYSPFFTSLFRSMGIHHFPYFNDVPDWRADYKNHSKTLKDRNFYRSVKVIEPNISSIVNLFEQAISKLEAS